MVQDIGWALGSRTTLPRLIHMEYMDEGWTTGIEDGIYGMVDGIHGFARWNPLICDMKSGLARWTQCVDSL
jgi:hypothetical protein